MDNRNASTVAWAALVVALLALVLAWVGYSRNGNTEMEGVDQMTEEVQDVAQDPTQVVEEGVTEETVEGTSTDASVEVTPAN